MKRSYKILAATGLAACCAVAAISVVGQTANGDVTVKGRVVAYLLDERGEVGGFLLDSKDQVRVSRGAGRAIAARVKPGDEITAIGAAGTASTYGREVRAREVSANGHTVTEIGPPPPGHGRPGGPPPGPQDRQAGPPDGGPGGPPPPPGEGGPGRPRGDAPPQGPDGPRRQPPPPDGPPPPPPAPSEEMSVKGTVASFLVDGRGEVNGFILASGEQVRLAPEAGEFVVKAGAVEVTVDGRGFRTERGTIVWADSVTIGNKTVATR